MKKKLQLNKETVAVLNAKEMSKVVGQGVPDCPMEGGGFFPNPDDCHFFYQCSNGVAYLKECPGDLHWNSELDTCDYSDRANCFPTSIIMTIDVTMTPVSIPPSPSQIQVNCQPKVTDNCA